MYKFPASDEEFSSRTHAVFSTYFECLKHQSKSLKDADFGYWLMPFARISGHILLAPLTIPLAYALTRKVDEESSRDNDFRGLRLDSRL